MKNIIISIIIAHLIVLESNAQTHYGSNAGTLGVNHSYFGNYAGNDATNGSSDNTYFGGYSGELISIGDQNTAMGYRALHVTTEGSSNVSLGAQSLFVNTVGNYNVAAGRGVLTNNNTSGVHSSGDNIGLGYTALYYNTTGYDNIAIGNRAMFSHLTGRRNVAIGGNAASGIAASENAVTGSSSNLSSGDRNAIFGNKSFHYSSGEQNAAFGHQSLYAADNSCALTRCSAMGAQSGTFALGLCQSFTNATAIGNGSRFTASNQIRVGNSSTTSIGGQVSWSTLSDGRFKKDLKTNVSGLAFINQLNPVSYILDHDAYNKFLGVADSARAGLTKTTSVTIRQIGFIAQEVDAIVKKSGYVFSGVDAPQNENDTYTLRYAEFVVPLVKAVQELSAMNDSREKEIAKLQEALLKFKNDEGLSRRKTHTAALSQNNPNPFTTTTEIQVELAEGTRHASLMVYTLEGKQLKDIRVTERGTSTLNISSTGLIAGMYLYTLIVDGKVVETKRFIVKK